MAKKPVSPQQLIAKVDFDCIEDDCKHTIQFNLMSLKENKGQITCPSCHRPYKFDKSFLSKLEKLRTMVQAVKEAEDILGNCNVAITTPAGEVKIPYQLLLTRLNTLISLNVGDYKIDFNFRIEPLNDGTFK